MTPWDAQSFAKHNRHASKSQLRAAAKEANRVLKKTGDDGAAVRAGNGVIRRMKGSRK